MKFRLKEDWYVEDFFDKVKIYDAGQIFTPTEDGRYLMKGLNGSEMYLRYENMLDAKGIGKDGLPGEPLFEAINEQEIELIVEEVKDDEIEDVKKWRIQLDVNTTQSKLKEIQKFIQENIPDML
jgi:hypothetical protein